LGPTGPRARMGPKETPARSNGTQTTQGMQMGPARTPNPFLFSAKVSLRSRRTKLDTGRRQRRQRDGRCPPGAPRHKKLTLRRPAEGRCGIRTAGLTWNTLSRGEVFQAIRMSTTQFGRASSGQTPRIRLIRRNIRVCISEQGNAMNDRWLIMMAVLLVIAVAAWAAVVFLALH
jgi:hypothetical protein